MHLFMSSAICHLCLVASYSLGAPVETKTFWTVVLAAFAAGAVNSPARVAPNFPRTLRRESGCFMGPRKERVVDGTRCTSSPNNGSGLRFVCASLAGKDLTH